MTPMAAASVAVATPAYIEPMTSRISVKTGMRKRDCLTFSLKAICGSGAGL
jgi:hypothetical protein